MGKYVFLQSVHYENVQLLLISPLTICKWKCLSIYCKILVLIKKPITYSLYVRWSTDFLIIGPGDMVARSEVQLSCPFNFSQNIFQELEISVGVLF